MKSKIKNHAGYTLIELLTVVTIIGILASIAIPNYRGYRDKAKMVTIYATMHQVMLAQEVYFTDFERFFPADSDGNNVSGVSNPLGGSIPVTGTDLSILVPNGQIWTINSEGDKDTPIKSYTVGINPHFGETDYFFYNRIGSTVVTNIPNLQ